MLSRAQVPAAQNVASSLRLGKNENSKEQMRERSADHRKGDQESPLSGGELPGLAAPAVKR